MSQIIKCKIYITCLIAITCIYSNDYHKERTLTVMAVGDMRISEWLLNEHSSRMDSIRFSGDIIFGNFEGVIADSEYSFPILNMPAKTLRTLRNMNFNVLSLANNHSMDLGIKQYEYSKRLLASNGFGIAGYQDSGTVLSIGDISIRIVGFTFTGPNNVNYPAQAARMISSFSEDIIIVSAHMGSEHDKGYITPDTMEYFYGQPRGDVSKFSKACIDAGADLIIGHSPHIFRKVELYKRRLIAYSLGNFMFDFPGVNRITRSPTLALRIELDKNGLFIRAEVISYNLNRGVPEKDYSEWGYRWLKKLSVNEKSNTLRFENGIITPLHLDKK